MVLDRMLSIGLFSTGCPVTDFRVLRKHDAKPDCGTDQNLEYAMVSPTFVLLLPDFEPLSRRVCL